MATAELESVAEFKRRASALGVTEAHLNALVGAGFDTFGKYAFAVPYVPGAADEKPLVDLLKKTFGGVDPKDSELACLRRLFWESHALALADLKQRQEHGSDNVTKKLPTSERVARLQDQKKRLSGVIWGPDTEPSDQLVDRFVQMSEDNVAVYVKPELCTSRSQEVLQVKQAKNFSIGSDGNLKVGQATPDFTCSTSGELRLRAALHRKALAMDLSGVLSYKVAELWHTSLFTCLQREAPPGYKAVTVSQTMHSRSLNPWRQTSLQATFLLQSFAIYLIYFLRILKVRVPLLEGPSFRDCTLELKLDSEQTASCSPRARRPSMRMCELFHRGTGGPPLPCSRTFRRSCIVTR